MGVYTYPLEVPPGHSPPLAVVSPQDHRAWVYIATALGLSMTLLSSAIRVFIRWSAGVGLGLDDVALASSTIISFCQSGAIFAAGHHGLGSSSLINPVSSLDRAQRLYYASNLLYVLALGLSRQSVLLFLRRITPIRAHRKALAFLLIAEGMWTLVFVLSTALQCDLRSPWILSGSCSASWLARWEAAEISGIALEIGVLFMAIWTLVWDLQVANYKRATIAVAFVLRLLIMVIFIALRVSSFDRQGFSTDPTLHEAEFICWTQAEMNVSIIAATVPIAHRFLASLVSYYGGAGGRNLSQSRAPTLRTTSEAITDFIPFGSLHSSRSGKQTRSDSLKPDDPRLETYGGVRRESVQYSVGIQHQDRAVGATPRLTMDRQSMMIRKDVTYEIEYND